MHIRSWSGIVFDGTTFRTGSNAFGTAFLWNCAMNAYLLGKLFDECWEGGFLLDVL